MIYLSKPHTSVKGLESLDLNYLYSIIFVQHDLCYNYYTLNIVHYFPSFVYRCNCECMYIYHICAKSW